MQENETLAIVIQARPCSELEAMLVSDSFSKEHEEAMSLK